MSDIGQQFQKDAIQQIAMGAGLFAVGHVVGRMGQGGQGSAQQDELIYQQQRINQKLWIQNELLAGRSKEDIWNEIADAEDRRDARVAAEQQAILDAPMTLSCVLCTIVAGLMVIGLGLAAISIAWTLLFG